jgi:TolB-like protein/Flp pilus assembly protein TadD
MVDVFLSYASDDRERVRPLVEAFERQGWSVWWDQEIRTGESWDRRIEEALDACRVCVAAFSHVSVNSQWVRNEAMATMEAGKLLPVQLDDAPLPIAFRSLQTTSLIGWRGGADPRLQGLVEAVAARMAVEVAAVPRAMPPARPERRGLLIGAVVVAALAVAATVFVQIPDGTNPQGAAPAAPAPASSASIAVLPLENLSTDDENAFFALGIYEDILNSLTRVPDLMVISRNSTERAMAEGPGMNDMAAELGVAHVLVGSVRRSGNRVRVSVRLEDARTNQSVWGETYDRELTDIFAIQSEIARSVMNALSVRLAVGKPESANRTDNVAAYDLYLEARELIRTLRVSTDGERALVMVDRAIELDPGFADAHALRARIRFALLGRTRGFAYAKNVVLEDAERAFELDPDNAQAHAIMASFRILDPFAAIPHATRAVELNPGDAEAQSLLAQLLDTLNRHDEAFLHHRQAFDLDPLDATKTVRLANALERRGRSAEADDFLRKAVALDPQNSQTHRVVGYFYGRFRGDYYNGLRHSVTARALDPDEVAIIESIAIYLAALGAGEAALTWSEKMEEMGANRGWQLFVRGYALQALGRADELVESARESQVVQPDDSARLAWAYAQAASALELAGQAGEAEALREEVFEELEHHAADPQGPIDPNTLPERLSLAVVAIHNDRRDIAAPILEAAMGIDTRGALVATGVEKVVALTLLGRTDEALAAMRELSQNRPPPLWAIDAWGLGHDQIYGGIGDLPDFRESVARIEADLAAQLERARADLPELFESE